MGLCGVWYQGTHTYLPDEISNNSNSSDDDRSYTSVHNGYTKYTGRKREKATEGGGGGSKEVA